jgi:hypothetical protein
MELAVLYFWYIYKKVKLTVINKIKYPHNIDNYVAVYP